MKLYTVFGVYKDNHQRHGDTVEARNPKEAQLTYAEMMAPHDILIAAVVEGDVKAVDSQDNAEWPSIDPDCEGV